MRLMFDRFCLIGSSPFGSVVEHSLGKGEVAGPIPAKGTSFCVAAGFVVGGCLVIVLIV
jgi:hypothetical protein